MSPEKNENMLNVPVILVLIDSLRDSDRSILCGVRDYALNNNIRLIKKTVIKNNVNNLISKNVIGILRYDTKHEGLDNLKIPTIVYPQYEPDPNYINIVDNSQETSQTVFDYLRGRNLGKFAFCGLGNHIYWSRERANHFLRIGQKAGYEVFAYEVFKGRHNKTGQWSREQKDLLKWLQRLPKPIGLMVCDDELAEEVLDLCKLGKINVPNEIAVLGVDNDETVCCWHSPQLSSVRLNFEKAGYEAAKILHEISQGKKVREKQIYIEPIDVIARQSTDILKVEDEIVIKALLFIEKHHRKSIQVNDIAEALLVSRKHLERLFKKNLNRTVLEEINNARIEEISRLLRNTDMPIYKIAEMLKLESSSHMSRFFKNIKKITPTEYRKLYRNGH
jgi:LacI family transcriptional regulator